MKSILRSHILQKRGGSSGGGGGGKTTETLPSTRSTFSVQTDEIQVQKKLESWDAELELMKDSLSGESNKYSKVETELLLDAYEIASTIREFSKGSKTIGIVDNKGNLQATAMYQKNSGHTYIEYLATSPWNFTNDSRAVRGAGAKAIVEAIKLDRAAGGTGEIRLEALFKAVPFYKKLGFKQYGENDGLSFPSLKLSASDARALLRKYGEN